MSDRVFDMVFTVAVVATVIIAVVHMFTAGGHTAGCEGGRASWLDLIGWAVFMLAFALSWYIIELTDRKHLE
jgi:hypothetical protein